MNYSHAVFLMTKGKARAMACAYKAEENAKTDIFKTLDPSIKEGDYVIVETDSRHRMTVFKVIETDVDIDYDSSNKISWIVSKVDTQEIERNRTVEAMAISKIKQGRKKRREQELLEDLDLSEQDENEIANMFLLEDNSNADLADGCGGGERTIIKTSKEVKGGAGGSENVHD